jgi:hypothetical protein
MNLQANEVSAHEGDGSPPLKSLDVDKVKVSWREDDGSPLLKSLDVDEVNMCIKEPILLGAVPIKSELIEEVQRCGGCLEVHTVIARQWEHLILGLSRADQLTVLGYSFPKEDHHGRFLFQEAIRRRKGRRLPIEFYELDRREVKEQTRAAICNVFGSVATGVTYRGPVEPAPLA